MRQNEYDYTKIHDYPEIRVRVELLEQRLRQIGASADAAVLEVALGSGDVTRLLAQTFNNLTCVDSMLIILGRWPPRDSHGRK
jgi:ubiquinone/menaquinone biosynthesis C-methylase UbiE